MQWKLNTRTRFIANRLIFFVLFLFLACTTYVDIKGQEKGSVENPVICDMPAGERAYLKLLRDSDGNPVEYEYLDSILGTQGRILDRFEIANPARKNDDRSIEDMFLDMFRDEPLLPPAFRIYMDMYHPGERDTEPIKGFRFVEDDQEDPTK